MSQSLGHRGMYESQALVNKVFDRSGTYDYEEPFLVREGGPRFTRGEKAKQRVTNFEHVKAWRYARTDDE